MSGRVRGLAESVQVRLVRHAKAIGVDPNLVLARYAVERLLYRLSRSRYADRFVLKGALLLLVWLGETIRPTRDADLLGFGDLSHDAVTAIFREIGKVEVEPDGMSYDLSTIDVAPIRPEHEYGGIRVSLLGRLGSARLRVQVDIGIGDAVVPAPTWLDYPSLLDLPRPRLRAYRPETVIAEKVHAMVVLGVGNSRMRDFFDVHVLAERRTFEGAPLVEALRATFEGRRTAIPDGLPIALTGAFADANGKRAQWQAFLRKNRLSASPYDLKGVVTKLAAFLAPLMESARLGRSLAGAWPAGGPWRLPGVDPSAEARHA